MKIDVKIFREPDLEFGGGVLDPNPKVALPKAGPFLVGASHGIKTIPLGLVAPPKEIDPILRWFERMKKLLVSDESNVLRYPRFPGVQSTLGVNFEFDPRFILKLGKDFDMAIAHLSHHTKFEELLKVYIDGVQSLCTDTGPKCILVCFPEEVAFLSIENRALAAEERRLLERLSEDEHNQQMELFDRPEDRSKLAELLPRAEELLTRNFHRAFKARCMSVPNAIPTQVIRQQTYAPIEAKQSEATRAWNLSVALLYKTGNIPWRPAELDQETCFAGISFHHLKTRGSSLVYSSVAHAFSNAVEPFILKGAPIPQHQTRDKQPFLMKDQAAEIGRKLIAGFKKRTGSAPARIIIHKTSSFQAEEEEGIREAAAGEVGEVFTLWLRPTGFRLLRRGMQEPLRGTLCRVGDDRNFLFTTGYVKWWEEYPGPHIPAPLEIGGAEDIDSRAREVLSLSKMNWNTADGIGRFPITLSFARRVGMIMTELGDDVDPNPSYRFYM
ncbi:MAG TPA: hypothetical protein VFC44_18360 [Candidatus Saccharimonadales bacterium]|nr:hypothetical protein [Candidatus Saccharimonadales bacterium]